MATRFLLNKDVSMSKVVRKNYPQLGEVKAPYVHSVTHGNTLYISGLTAFGTQAQQGSIAAQAEEIFKQIRTVTICLPALSLKSAASFHPTLKLKLKRFSASEGPPMAGRRQIALSIYLKYSVKQTIFILTWLRVE